MPRVHVDVMLKPEILDPQGQAVERALPAMGFEGLSGVRIGKHIELDVADDVADVQRLVDEVAAKLLANPVIEAYTITLLPPRTLLPPGTVQPAPGSAGTPADGPAPSA